MYVHVHGKHNRLTALGSKHLLWSGVQSQAEPLHPLIQLHCPLQPQVPRLGPPQMLPILSLSQEKLSHSQRSPKKLACNNYMIVYTIYIIINT